MRRTPITDVHSAEDQKRAKLERSTLHVGAARLGPRDVPPALRREIDAVYAADFDLLGYRRF